jgi:hypothetical protein
VVRIIDSGGLAGKRLSLNYHGISVFLPHN